MHVNFLAISSLPTPMKFLPWTIKNEIKEEVKIRKPFNVETFKSESAQVINIQMELQDLHSEIAGRNNVNAYMVSLLLSNYVNDICDYLIEL